jgi:hypothetical protein
MQLDNRIDAMYEEAVGAKDPEMATGMILFGRIYCGILYEEKNGGDSHIKPLLEDFGLDREKARGLFAAGYSKAFECVDKGIEALKKIKQDNSQSISDEEYAQYFSEAGDCYRHAAECTELKHEEFDLRYSKALAYFTEAKSLSREGDKIHNYCTLLLTNILESKESRANLEQYAN